MTTTTQTHRPRLLTPAYPELAQATDPDREARYAAALQLVTRIESNIFYRYYVRASDKAVLTTVMEVVNAILDDDLLLHDKPLIPIGCHRCKTEPKARGLCNACYTRWHKRGKPAMSEQVLNGN